MNTLWQARMQDGPEPAMLAFTESLSFDVELAEMDIFASVAHIKGLKKAKLINAQELEQMLAALEQTRKELAEGAFEFVPTDEDIHTAIERRVTEIAGSAGAKLHTGRSRNDQVATALRLWTGQKLSELGIQIKNLQTVLYKRAQEVGDAPIPGYTHLQRAQPVFLAEHLLAHGWALFRDADRISDALNRMDVSPLGAGALAGSSLGIDSGYTAGEMGFAASYENSLDAVSDRDFVAEVLFVLALLGVHLSRMGEEIVFWSSEEVGFLQLPEGWSTGSSMLPQKKNPDIAELVRGKSGRLIGNLTGLLTTLKGLPLAYNRDLQEDKEPLFDSFKAVQLGLVALAGLMENCRFELAAMAKSASAPELSAIALAEHMVKSGVPFREAHSKVSSMVRKWQEEGADPIHTVEQELGKAAADLIPAPPFGNLEKSLKAFSARLKKGKKGS